MPGFNPSVEGQPLQQTILRIRKHILSSSFNPSVEGQPLQPLTCHGEDIRKKSVSIPLSRDSHCNMYTGYERNPTRVFQSLCRGTAIATRQSCFPPRKNMQFQSLCRGTAIATSGSWNMTSALVNVSIPLSRDSHCNVLNALTCVIRDKVSIPLSRDSHCNYQRMHKGNT